MLTELNEQYNTTIVMVLHDINLSARYANNLIAMKNGRIIAEGTPQEIVTPKLISDIYGLNCEVIKDPVSKAPMIIPKGRYHSSEMV